MKMTFKPLAVVALLLSVATLFTFIPDAALAAPGGSTLMHQLPVGDLLMASPALLTLRNNLEALEATATRVEERITDDLEPDQVRALEDEHVGLLAQIEETRSAITELEAEEAAAGDGADGDANATRDNLTAAQALEIVQIGRRAGMPEGEAETAVRNNTPVEDFRRTAFEHMARDAQSGETNPARGSQTQILQDEQETRRDAMVEAMSYRLGVEMPENGPSAAAREHMEIRSISGFAASSIGFTGRLDSVRAIDDLFDRAANSQSDFPIVFTGAINRTLEGRYALAQPTYRRIARRSDFRDFRPHTTVKLGDFPMLKKVAEDGEIKYGSFSEGKEQVQAFAYARALSVTRQMLINDDLAAIGELLSSYGDTIALFEEITFYASALNAKLADGKTVFHSAHGNLAGTGKAISVDSVAAGRTAMSKQKSLEGNPLLSNKPRILLCGPDTVTEAEKLLTSITPATVSNVNIFSGKLEALETSQITGLEWYLLPDAGAGQHSNYRWGMLQGYEAPRVRIDEPFGRQGMAMSVEHDFGVGATDSRHAWKNPGAAAA